jgi:hypothetical protein
MKCNALELTSVSFDQKKNNDVETWIISVLLLRVWLAAFGASEVYNIRSCALAYFYQRFAFSVRDQKFFLPIELLILLLLSIISMSELLIER